MVANTEIERRFLVDGRGEKPWRLGVAHSIKQYYLASDFPLPENIPKLDNPTIRIRVIDDKKIMTVKGPRVNATCEEYEWEVDSMPDVSGCPMVEKIRYVLEYENLLWEIDEFEGALAGLILAEVELESESQHVDIPAWCGAEITGLYNWSNAALAKTLIANM